TQTSVESSAAIFSNTLMPGDSIPSSFEIRIRHLLRSIGLSAMGLDYLLPAHIGLQRLGDRDGAVVALKVLEDRDHRAADRQAGAVQRMHRPRPLALCGPVARLHALRLERAAIRAAGDLAIGTLARQPNFQVVGLL